MRQQSCHLFVAVVGILFCCKLFAAVEFEPGVGLGVESTDNVTLSPEATVADQIAVGYVGASISENEGPLKYDASASFNKYKYVRGTFEDQRYFNLTARADWAMIRERFNWFLSNRFTQVPIRSINSNTPGNLQDSNVFTFGANTMFPVSARQGFSLTPVFSQYYFEKLLTDNKQYSLAASWNYQMFRLTGVGLNFSVRNINYTEKNALGRSIEDTKYTTIGFTFNGQGVRSGFSGNLGATKIERKNGDVTTGFSGFLDWFINVSSRSKFDALASTTLTDASSAALSSGGGVGNDVQITTDVIRNGVFELTYTRDDELLRTQISARYRKLTYSDSPRDRIVRFFSVDLNYPVTQLMSSSVYTNYYRTNQLDINRLDDNYIVGGNLNYRFSRKLRGLFDLKYRTKESTTSSQNFNELSVFASLVYGFGGVRRPTRVGGY